MSGIFVGDPSGAHPPLQPGPDGLLPTGANQVDADDEGKLPEPDQALPGRQRLVRRLPRRQDGRGDAAVGSARARGENKESIDIL